MYPGSRMIVTGGEEESNRVGEEDDKVVVVVRGNSDLDLNTRAGPVRFISVHVLNRAIHLRFIYGFRFILPQQCLANH